jgi:2-iminobutanoate/2-iminopropanoate deaminase
MNAVYGSYFKKDPPARATVKAGLAGKGFGIEITFVASSAPRVSISPNPTLPLSGAVQTGNRLYLSGVLGNTSTNAGDATAQTRETLSRIRKTLESAGYSPAQVVESIVYLTDLSQFQAMNAEYREFFGKDFPARTTVGTGLVAPGAVIEIMMTAVK